MKVIDLLVAFLLNFYWIHSVDSERKYTTKWVLDIPLTLFNMNHQLVRFIKSIFQMLITYGTFAQNVAPQQHVVRRGFVIQIHVFTAQTFPMQKRLAKPLGFPPKASSMNAIQRAKVRS